MNFYNNEYYADGLEQGIMKIVDVKSLFHKRILITGASGLVGSALVDMLLKLNEVANADVEIFALGRNKAALEQRFSNIFDKLHFIVQDVNDIEQLENNIDILIHAASNANPSAYAEDPVGTIEGNTQATLNLLRYCQKVKAEQFIYISSGEVYGQLPKESIPFTEEMAGYIDSMNVRSCYMLAKKLAENLCVSYTHQYGLKTKIVRLSHVFGANYTTKDTRASAQFVTEAIKGRDIVLKSLGNHLRSYVHVIDAVSGILSVTTVGQNASVYNVTNTDNTLTLAEFAQTVAKEAKVSVKFDIMQEVDPTKVTPISFAVLSDVKLRSLGWEPTFSTIRGVEQIIKILKDKKSC
ncbi:NAD-dependent epimerase/dehydratase family protein [Lactococcus cremoris]|uniref:NAD-dependent epimerase/dehydratase family protein n=1 Tax=Lactococcus lactis subsp. cremoris TaxID=1359 RepID=UPI00218252D4|nr:NAD-dependent epimerase/dehydratase family protein [Lactococcus cremoris]MCT0501074.1 NAD-dependent epimerase/dehydratase family protein [Lactococcus cremoris]